MTAVVLPGDRVEYNTESVVVGPGLSHSASSLVTTSSGLLGRIEKDGSTSVWVEGSTKRYIPSVGDSVIGVITARHAEGYRVDIGSSTAASLDALAFQDATKRNKPNLKIGATVYARVALALPYVEPELECFDAQTGKSKGFGELEGGMVIKHLEINKCKALLQPKHPLLTGLAKKNRFELAIGINGRLWLKAEAPEQVIQISSAITAL